MSGRDADNEKRLIAAEIVRQLWVAKNATQLELLRAQINSSLQQIRGAGMDGEYEGTR